MRKLFFALLLLLSLTCFSQQEAKEPKLDLSGYIEVYYLYDFNKPPDHERPNFVYSYNRANEFNINLGFIKAAYANSIVRANLALMSGTYPNANLKNEPGVLRNIFEANAGVKLSKTKELWVDAGIFASHIGFESAVGKDSWNLTRSLLADNSPYYESGIKVSYTTTSGKWFLSGLILNGWQRIQMVEGNSLPSFGTQFMFKPSDKITLNSSSFIGTDKPDSARVMRYFHNFYGVLQLSENVSLTAGFDNGFEEKGDGTGYNTWYSPVVIVRTKVNDRISFDVRGEYYHDRYNVIVETDLDEPFRTKGASMNLDYQITSKALWRIEFRYMSADRDIFIRRGNRVRDSSFITTCLAINF